ncbi:hypothetical protein [Cohnella sp. GbtcB17]|uniref:hypothetical protein n=1 Tax=Cohnella sp. GbtcB17 TaxID=2824762 RepID=UPI001C3110E3|nr:hypothetical protein [Cohnella sp. GbtcB17]
MSFVTTTPGTYQSMSLNPVHQMLSIGDDVWVVAMKSVSTFTVYKSSDRGATFAEFTTTNFTSFGQSVYSSSLRRMVGLYKVGGKAMLLKIDTGLKVFNLTDDIYLKGAALAVTLNNNIMSAATNEVNSNLYVFCYRGTGSPSGNLTAYMHKTNMATNPTGFDSQSLTTISTNGTTGAISNTGQSLSSVVANSGKVYLFFARVTVAGTPPTYGGVFVSIHDPAANTWTAPVAITTDTDINTVHVHYDTQTDMFHLFYQQYTFVWAYYASFTSAELTGTITPKAGEKIVQGSGISTLKSGYFNRGMQAPVCMIREQTNTENLYVRGSSGWRIIDPPAEIKAVQFRMFSAQNNKDNQIDTGALTSTSLIFGRFAAFANTPPDTNSGAPTAAYVLEMRRYLNARQTELGLPVTAWANPIAAGTAVKEADLTEIMTAITALAGTIGNTADHPLSNPWSQLYLNIDATSN